MNDKEKIIWVENSTWNNIGDGFYQSALLFQIQKLFPNANVIHGEGPATRTFQPSHYFIKNVFECMLYQEADIYVFSGPMLRQLWWRYDKMIKSILKRGKKYVIFSASAADASPGELKCILDFLSEYPPVALSLRDNEHFAAIRSAVPNAISSICAAFLLGDLPIANVDLGLSYIVTSFYTVNEPVFKMEGEDWTTFTVNYKKPIFPKLQRIWRHFEWMRSGPEFVGDYLIVRVRQEAIMKFSHLIFRKKNSYSSMNPLSFLSIYNGCDFVVSDRVHVCVAGLAMRKPVLLVKVDRRSHLFDQKGIVCKHPSGFMTLNSEALSDARSELLSYIEKFLKSALK